VSAEVIRIVPVSVRRPPASMAEVIFSFSKIAENNTPSNGSR
jgi:hypothetical protein